MQVVTRVQDAACVRLEAGGERERMVEVVVVGAGIAGVATAFALSSRGAAVNLVDVGRPANAATGASAGMLAPQYESPGPGPVYRAGIRGRAEWPEFARLLSDLAGRELPVVPSGMLVANFTAGEEDGAREAMAWQRAAGQRAELLSPASARALQEGLGDDARSWLWLPDEAQVDAQRLVDVFAAALRASPIRLLTGSPVREVAIRGGAVRGVTLEDGRRLHADRVVLAAGVWSAGLAGLPVRPVRGQMLRLLPGPPRLDRLVASHHGHYMVPRQDGSILAGSTMEEVGLDRSITDEGADLIRRSCARLVPAAMARRPLEQWADLRPLSPDGLPILGADPAVEGLFHATGYGRNGILLGPVLGEVLADLVMGGMGDADPPIPATDLAAFDPARFKEVAA